VGVRVCIELSGWAGGGAKTSVLVSANANFVPLFPLALYSSSKRPALFYALDQEGVYQRTLFSVVAEKTTLITPAPQRPLRATQATRGIACPKPSEEPQVSTSVAGGGLCALRRHLLAGQVFFESKNLTVNPFKTG
jgi:hypothetical protein